PPRSSAHWGGSRGFTSRPGWSRPYAGIGTIPGGGSRSAPGPTASITSASTAARSRISVADSLAKLTREVVDCRKCPRLVAWREEVARVKRAAYAQEGYWGRPLPGFGDPRAGIMVLGLAPAAHGGNRTGRIFTGDRSG